ncbi:unnamed protein product [Meloidogyne enterolobii]|uniref:Uncharacterized protein n=1 Tax=Meloidogyne enterolobii TaxID=390850 RepID=A0ACB1B6T5_MELEN
MKTLFKIFFAHPRHEILPIIEKQDEFYPFEEKLKNLYLNKKSKKETELKKYEEIMSNSTKILLNHINLKKMKVDDSMKQVYDLLLKRIDAFSGRRLLNDDYYSYFKTVCDLTKQPVLNEENFDRLITIIENLLILFEFKSAYAVEFGQKLRETDTKTQKCLKNLINLKLENEGRTYKGLNSTLRSNDGEEMPANQDARLKIMLTKQGYFKKLREIMEIAMLMEGEHEYSYWLQKELQAVHKKGNITGVIKFLFLHIDKDMGKIMELYKKDELEKDLKMFENRFYGVNNFLMAYKQILSQIQDESKNCYTVTEKEHKLLSELETLELKDDAKYSRIYKLLLELINTILKKYNGNFPEIPVEDSEELDLREEVVTPNKEAELGDLIRSLIEKYLYNVNLSDLNFRGLFSELRTNLVSEEEKENILKEANGYRKLEHKKEVDIFKRTKKMIEFIGKEIVDFKKKLNDFKDELIIQKVKISEDDKMFHDKIEIFQAVVDKLIQKYLSPFIDIISFGDIGRLSETIINDEFTKMKMFNQPILENSIHSIHQEGEISKEAEIHEIEPEIHVDNGVSNSDIPTPLQAEIQDNESVNGDDFPVTVSEHEKVVFSHIELRKKHREMDITEQSR